MMPFASAYEPRQPARMCGETLPRVQLGHPKAGHACDMAGTQVHNVATMSPCCASGSGLPLNACRRLNWRQSARFGLVGLTLHGPFFYSGFRWLDSRFGTAATLQKVRSAARRVQARR